MAGAPLVRLGQVDVLEVHNESLGVPGSVDTPHVGGDDHAHLVQLLNDVSGGRLGTAVDDGHMGRAKLVEAVAQEELLAPSVWPHQEERLHAVSVEPRAEHAQTLLHGWRQDHREVVAGEPRPQITHGQIVWNLR